jgi:hypothetical protein
MNNITLSVDREGHVQAIRCEGCTDDEGRVEEHFSRQLEFRQPDGQTIVLEHKASLPRYLRICSKPPGQTWALTQLPFPPGIYRRQYHCFLETTGAVRSPFCAKKLATNSQNTRHLLCEPLQLQLTVTLKESRQAPLGRRSRDPEKISNGQQPGSVRDLTKYCPIQSIFLSIE